MSRKSYSTCNGQMTLFGTVIHVCDVCGRKITKPGRHPRCEERLGNAKQIIKDWAMQALQREYATKKHQTPPISIRVLSRLSGVKIDDFLVRSIPQQSQPPGCSG